MCDFPPKSPDFEETEGRFSRLAQISQIGNADVFKGGGGNAVQVGLYHFFIDGLRLALYKLGEIGIAERIPKSEETIRQLVFALCSFGHIFGTFRNRKLVRDEPDLDHRLQIGIEFAAFELGAFADLIEAAASIGDGLGNRIVDGRFAEFLMQDIFDFVKEYSAFREDILDGIVAQGNICVKLNEIVRDAAKDGIGNDLFFR